MVSDSELVRKAVRFVKRQEGVGEAGFANELAALADKLATHALVPGDDVFEAELLADDQAEFFQLRGNHRSAAPFVELRDRLRAAREATPKEAENETDQ